MTKTLFSRMRSLQWWVLIYMTFGVICDVPAQNASSHEWWKHAIIYEIYPRSFQDSNADGVGDLNGITQRMQYLQDLGVDAIWIAPMYPSPQVDFGYDISDYRNVDPQFGTIADFDRLVSEARKHRVAVIVDMVLNHTSDQHPWFVAAASARANPKHDWYVWSDGKRNANGDIVPPNNWQSVFGGSAWEWVPEVQQFYYHAYYKQQPDLNWRNPQVEKAMFDVMRFWLDRGVAGFRLDSISELFEDPRLRDAPRLEGLNALGNPQLDPGYTTNLPEIHETIRRMRAMVSAYPGDRVLIGEAYFPNIAELDKWYGGARHNEIQLPMDLPLGYLNELDANAFRKRLWEVYTQVHGSTPLLVFDNHDVNRSWDRYGDGVHNVAIAKLIAALLLTSRDTALLYQGQEIGQRTVEPRRIEDVKDPIGKIHWPVYKGRDGERTPMQWDSDDAQSGFSTSPHPWLPVPADYTTVNVRTELADPRSLLNWYKQLISLRRSNAAVRNGRVVMLDKTNANVLSYARVAKDGTAVLVALNMSAQPQSVSFHLSEANIRRSHLTNLMTSPEQDAGSSSVSPVRLAPFGVWIEAVE